MLQVVENDKSLLVDDGHSILKNLDSELNNEEIAVLGDESGENQGTVSTYNKLAVFLSSYIPFE